MTLRPAGPEDAEALAGIVRDSYRELPAALVPADMPAFHAESHIASLEDPDTRWLLLQDGARREAFAMWRMLPGLAHLHLLFVRRDSQGRGFGRMLLNAQYEAARAEQPELRLFTLHCMRDSTWAMRFYKRQGFSLYEPGDEYRVTDLYVWIDACRRHDNGWPLRAEKALFYKRTH